MAKYDLEGTEVKYSPTERLLFSFLPQDGSKITTEELVRRRIRIRSKPWEIENPRNAISTTMHYGLMRKVAENDEDFRIVKSPKLGPYPTEYWILSKRAFKAMMEAKEASNDSSRQKDTEWQLQRA